MAVKTREEILAQVRTRIGDDASDDAIALVEDISDTMADFEARASDSTDWKSKYEENDREWRKKYRDRFFDAGTDDNNNGDNDDDDETPLTFEDLFKEKE